MKREIIFSNNEAEWLELRKKDITSTEISALFGISPYATEFEVWHRHKNGVTVEFQSNDRMKWGTRLQDSIAKGIAEDHGWEIRRMNEYVRLSDLRIGSSFDFCRIFSEELLEIKNVDSLQLRDKWIVDGDNIEAPPHIELQVQHQLLVSGSPSAHIGALIGGNKVILIKRDPDLKIHEAIKQKVALFWESIELNQEPKPDFSQDAEFISKLYGYAEPGKVFDAKNHHRIEDLMDTYQAMSETVRVASQARDTIKAEVLTLIGDAEKVLGNGWSISAGIIGASHIEFDRKPYRNFKPTFKKEKFEERVL